MCITSIRNGTRILAATLLAITLLTACGAPAQRTATTTSPPVKDQTTPDKSTQGKSTQAPTPPDSAATDGTARAATEPALVPYDGEVWHIFFHPLIAYPERAFDNDDMAQGFNDWMVTASEFKKMLPELYQKGYILIDTHELYSVADDRLVRKELRLPAGKKPLILSIDDMNYYEYMRENGTVNRLVLDEHGQVAAESTTASGQVARSYDNAIVPILDAFVRTHPDFSLHGAKGLIALTGYEGILGYRTQDRTSPTYEQEKAAALKVVAQLKATGWSFASHGYGHLSAPKISYDRFKQDTDHWKADVEPLIGPSDIYIYPFGASVPGTDEKFHHLLRSGFRVICSVGPDAAIDYADHYITMDRRHIDGMALQTQQKLLTDMFDANAIVDPVRPAAR